MMSDTNRCPHCGNDLSKWSHSPLCPEDDG